MSKLTIRPMRPEDLAAIAVQPAQAQLGPDLTAEAGHNLRAVGLGFTALVGNVPVLIAGVVLSMGDPAIAWAVLSEAAGKHMTALTRAIRRFLDSLGETVETGVARGFAAGRRWASLLGFRPMQRPVERWESREDMELWRRPVPASPDAREG